jgi:hypothetical protein
MPHLRESFKYGMILGGAILLANSISGCNVIGVGPGEYPHIGPLQTETVSAKAGKAKSVHVHLQMAAGHLTITGGAKQLLDGTISYNVPDWKPDMSYNVSGAEGTLMLMQPESNHSTLGGVKYDWQLHFSNDVLLSMAIEMGAGDSDLDFSGMQLRDLSVEAGAGNGTVDLSGPWKQNGSATFEAGVGSLHLKLPRDVGVHVTIDGGLGSVSAPGFQRDGAAYVNDLYGKSPITLEIHIEGGVGSVDLELVGSRGVV